MENRADLLEVTLHFGPNYVKVLMPPEKWDELYNEEFGYIDETNQERAVDARKF